jgi:hypothetical protein
LQYNVLIRSSNIIALPIIPTMVSRHIEKVEGGKERARIYPTR